MNAGCFAGIRGKSCKAALLSESVIDVLVKFTIKLLVSKFILK